jgi:hypothetical protein
MPSDQLCALAARHSTDAVLSASILKKSGSDPIQY